MPSHSIRMSSRPATVKKTYNLPPKLIARAKRILHARTETEAIVRSLQEVAHEVDPPWREARRRPVAWTPSPAVRLVLDTSVWIEHLRRDALAPLLPLFRGKYQLSMDALVAGELIAGCRSRKERRVVDALLSPFLRADRVRAAAATDIADAGRALSRLRERGVVLSNPAGALIDATIAVTTLRRGALLVSENTRDFERLSEVLPLQWETLAALSARLAA